MIENRGKFIERDLDHPFLPLNTEDADRVLFITFGGPNGSGKTSLWKGVLNMLTIVNSYVYPMSPKVVGVAEPPDIKVRPGSDLTWRNVAKSGIGIPGLIEPSDLASQLTKAKVFIKARRIIERQAVYNFPFSNTSFLVGGEKHFVHPSGFRGEMVSNYEKAKTVGFSALIRDRSTETTWTFQGNSNEGLGVRNYVTRCYKLNFLKPDDLTFIVMPEDGNQLISDGTRDEKERDVETRPNEFSLYKRTLVERNEQPFSKKIIEIRNDPTGKKNNISETALFASLMILALEQQHLAKLTISDGTPFILSLPIIKMLWEAQEQFDFDYSSKGHRLANAIYSNNFPEEGIVCGDISILGANRDSVRMIVCPK